MFVFFTITDLSRYIGIETLLISIPESLGLLAFGVSLVAAAVIGRWLLTRIEDGKDKKKITKKAEVR